MDKDFLKFMSFVAFMEAKKEAERDCSAEDTGWQDTIPTIRRKPDPATEALLLSRIRMPEKPVNKMTAQQKQQADRRRGRKCHTQTDAHALFHPVIAPGAVILPDKRRNGNTKRT